MSQLTDETKLSNSDVFIFYLHGGQGLIGRCTEIDNEKMLVSDPHYISIMVDEMGNKSTFLVNFSHPTLVVRSSSFFYYKDILTIYAPLPTFRDYFLRNL